MYTKANGIGQAIHDYIIDNNGTLQDLEQQVDNIRDTKTGKFVEHPKLV